jgi:hypothetical protein
VGVERETGDRIVARSKVQVPDHSLNILPTLSLDLNVPSFSKPSIDQSFSQRL